jgi:hypothetical protein
MREKIGGEGDGPLRVGLVEHEIDADPTLERVEWGADRPKEMPSGPEVDRWKPAIVAARP